MQGVDTNPMLVSRGQNYQVLARGINIFSEESNSVALIERKKTEVTEKFY